MIQPNTRFSCLLCLPQVACLRNNFKYNIHYCEKLLLLFRKLCTGCPKKVHVRLVNYSVFSKLIGGWESQLSVCQVAPQEINATGPVFHQTPVQFDQGPLATFLCKPVDQVLSDWYF
jgi:hypothetical protein